MPKKHNNSLRDAKNAYKKTYWVLYNKDLGMGGLETRNL